MSLDLNKEMILYADFMDEVKRRMFATRDIISTLANAPDQENAEILAETVFLQTRIVCELIALAALAAHSKFGLTADLYKSWHAQKTFRLLAKINPNCFPHPLVIQRNEGGLHMTEKPGQLSMKGLEKIYNQCGRVLHRGVIEHAVKGRQRIYDLNKPAKWLTEIASLLNEHAVLLLQHNAALIVQVDSSPTERTRVFLSRSDGPAVLIKQS